MSKALIGAATAAVLLGWSAASSAAVVFNTFGAGDSYNSGVGYTIDGGISQGIRFSPSASGFLSAIELAAGSTIDGSLTLRLDVRADSAGTPGAILETLDFSISVPFGSFGPPADALALGTTLLDSTLSYWLIASQPSPAGFNVPWNLNDIGALGALAFTNDGGATFTVNQNADLPAVRVITATNGVVAEPGVLALLALSLLGLGLAGRRRGVS